ncbi:hypothetical protein ABZP36_007959 [Zizania latifolia]
MWLLLLISVSFVSLLLFLSALSRFFASSSLFARLPLLAYIRRGAAAQPSFAYLLSGNRREGRKLLRLLLAVYHPRNRHLLHLSADAQESERAELAAAVAHAAPSVRAFGNIDVVRPPHCWHPDGILRSRWHMQALADEYGIKFFETVFFSIDQTIKTKSEGKAEAAARGGGEGFLHIDEYPPDANQGFDIPSALVTFPEFNSS